MLIGLGAFFLGSMLLMAPAGDQEARRELPAQIVAWGTIAALAFPGWWFKVRPRREPHRAQARSLRLRSAPGDPLGVFRRRFALLGQAASAKDTFTVRSANRRFASALIDVRMMEWLLGLPPDSGFEIQDGTLLCQTPRRADADVTWSLETMATFMAHVPPVIASLFGPRR